MAAAGSFTLEDDEDPQVIAPPPPSVVPIVNDACPAPSAPASAPAPTSPTPPSPLQHAPSSGLALHLRDPPKAHVDADLGVNTLTQAVSVLQENQKEIELTETHLQNLLRQQARLVAASKLLEQQKVLDVLAKGPELGYDTGRPIASLLVYRCCLRWGSFGADAPPSASAVLDHITALLLQATDEDGIHARHAAAAAARGRGGEDGDSSGGGGAVQTSGGVRTADQGQGLSEQAAAAATREVAYWLTVTSTLLALVDPHLPLQAAPSQRPASRGGSSPAHHHATTPLAAVAGDARASMARAASAAAAKVQEFKKRMGALGNNLLRLRGSMSHASAGAAAAASGGGASAGGGSTGGGGGGGKEGEQQHQHGGGGAAEEGQGAAAEGQHTEEVPPVPHPQAPAAPLAHPSAPALTTTAGAAEAQPPPRQPSPAPASAHPGTSISPSPSQCFRQQLDVLLQKSYNQMRDTLKRHVSAVLPGCVQQPLLSPMTPRSPSPRGAGSAGGAAGPNVDGGLEARGRSLRSGSGATDGGAGVAAMQGGPEGGSVGGAPPVTAAVPLQPWLDLIAVLSQHLELLRAAHVPRIIIRCLFKQTLVFIDVQLFNQLLLRPECCCTSNAHYLVAGLQLLDKWIAAPGQQAQARVSGSGSAGGAPAAASEDLSLLAEDLRHIRQAAHFLALANKGALRLDDFTAMCPALNVQQLYRLATTFWDDSPPPPQPPTPPAASPTAAEGAEGAKGAEGAEAAAEAAEGDGAAAEAEDVGTEKAVGSDGVAGEEGKAGEGVEAAEADAAVEPEAAVEGEAEADASAEAATAVMEAAVAAVAAAEAAAAADEAADARAGAAAAAPSSPSTSAAAIETAAAAGSPVVVSRNVSGEVLEEMKRRHAVANNGGLIVTFLLDDDSAPLIAPGGVVARQLLQLINEPRLHAELAEGLPPLLHGEDCPPQVFAFMTVGGSGSGSGSSSAAAVAAAVTAAAAAAGAEHAASA